MTSPDMRIVVETAAGVETGEFENAKNVVWTRFLSGVGEISFRLNRDDPKFALLTGLQSHIKVVREGVVVWRGIFDFVRETKDEYHIFASSYESLLAYYLVQPDVVATSTVRAFTAQKLGTQIAQVLFNEAKALTSSLLANFTLGTIENPYEESTTTEITSDWNFDYNSLYNAIQQLAISGGADFEIGLDKTFNFYRSKGSDKANIAFHYRTDEPSNMLDFQRDLDFRAIVNKAYVFGVGTGANYLSSISEDATSKSTYGLKERNLGMPKTLVDQDSLDKLSADQLKLLKVPGEVVSPSIVPSSIGLFDGWDIGDNVKLNITRGETNIDVWRRVVGVAVYYGNSGSESVHVYLEPKKE